MKTLAYLVYGDRREYQLELTYSVASAVHFLRRAPSDIRILLITDRPGCRPDLLIEYLAFDAAEFARWTLGGSYNHAAKVSALAAALERADGPVALLDTDTYFTAHPDRLFAQVGPGRSAMQAPDAAIGTLDYWQALLAKAPATVAGYPITGASPMNNSGVIALDPADRGIVPEMLALMQALHAIDPVFSIEQFAVTSVLARHTALTVVPEIVHHYWPGYERWFVHAALERADAAGFEALVDPFVRFGYPPKRRRDQLVARVRGRLGGWHPDYRFAYLAYRSALAGGAPDRANVWAAIAADALRKGGFPVARIRADFSRFMGRRPAWMDARAAAAWQALEEADR